MSKLIHNHDVSLHVNLLTILQSKRAIEALFSILVCYFLFFSSAITPNNYSPSPGRPLGDYSTTFTESEANNC